MMLHLFNAISVTAILVASICVIVELRMVKRRVINQDPKVLRNELVRWLPILSDLSMNLRAVKRLRNQMRFLVSHEEVKDEMVFSLVGIAAFDGEIELARGLKEFQQKCQETDSEVLTIKFGNQSSVAFGKESKVIIESWLSAVNEEHFILYSSLVSGVDFRQ